ncbi:MAG: helix-turn-helix domain-containing protein [bacterium]|nr:helix-turn-helix domain-containing protein [bacterium]
MVTVGELLQKARIQKEISLENVEKETRIRKRYLQAVEKNDWSIFSSRVYISGIIRSYASYLGVSPHNALAYFRRDFEKTEGITFKGRLPSLSILPETKKIMYGVLVCVMLLFFGYFGYQIRMYFQPPSITILAPQKRTFRNVDRVHITGQTTRESTITIFNEELFPSYTGIFDYEFPLSKGKNKLVIKVTGANGRISQLEELFVLE